MNALSTSRAGDREDERETVGVLTERYGPAYRWLVTGAGLVGMIAMVLSSTSVSVAVPQVMGAFGVGQDQAQWLATAFFATTTATMLLSAWLIARFGHRTTFVVTLLVFGAAAVVGGMAPNMETVILSRVLQGAAAGVVQPLSMAVIFTVFPPERRGTAMGLFGLGVVLAPAFGPALGGLFIDTFSWRAVFFLPLPLCGIALVLGSIFMPVRDLEAPRAPFDWIGISLLAMALACTLNGFASGQREGWSSDIIVIQLATGAAATLGFILWELNARAPLLDLTLFGNARFSSAAVVGFIFGFGMFGSIFVVAIFVQLVQGYTPTKAGVLLIPAGLLMAAAFPVAGRLVDSVPAHVPIMVGLFLFGVGFLMMASADANTSFWTFVAYLLVNRLGLSLIVPSLNTGALRSLRSDQVGQGAGIINFTRMLGGACGVNLLVVYLEMRTRLYTDALTATQTYGNQTSRALLERVERLLSESGVPLAHREPGAIHYLGEMVQAQANTFGFQETFLASAAISFAAIVPAWIMGRSRGGGATASPPGPGMPADSRRWSSRTAGEAPKAAE